ncbi:P-loop containing nucleoside triphosphate hydrolase protein, partial [Ampelomyces quisqualis]
AGEVAALQQRIDDERKLRLRQMDEFVGLKGGFRFLVVPKPRQLDAVAQAGGVEGEERGDDTTNVTCFNYGNHAVTVRDDNGHEVRFDGLDYVHRPAVDSIDAVWHECEPFVDGVVSQPARRLLMLAHGRTGSGKTHVMAHAEQGMIPRTLARLFEHQQREARAGHGVRVEATSVDLYRGDAYDCGDRKLVFTRDTAGAAGAAGGRWHARYAKTAEPGTGALAGRTPLPSLAAAHAFLGRVARQRAARTHATAANARSSRSHLVVALFVTVDRGPGGGGACEGSIHLADLAGNEGAQDAALAHDERTH